MMLHLKYLTLFVLGGIISRLTASSTSNSGNHSILALHSAEPGLLSDYFCRNVVFATWQGIPIKRCFKALRRMPSTHTVGEFHTNGHDDIWQLPRYEYYKNCAIRIQLAGPSTSAIGSWLGVKLAINELLFACEVRVDSKFTFPVSRPGFSSTGQNDRILVEVSRRTEYLGRPNETDIDDE